MYLVTLQQGERQHTVGLFRLREEAVQWIESITYVHKDVDVFDNQTYANYTIQYEEIPLYEEIHWKKTDYPLTKYMFTPDGGPIDVYISQQIPIIGEAISLVDGMTQVDAYLISNEETKAYIATREKIREAILNHYGRLGQQVETGGVGSEDGEFIRIEEGPFILLDADTVQLWEEATTTEEFFAQLENAK